MTLEELIKGIVAEIKDGARAQGRKNPNVMTLTVSDVGDITKLDLEDAADALAKIRINVYDMEIAYPFLSVDGTHLHFKARPPYPDLIYTRDKVYVLDEKKLRSVLNAALSSNPDGRDLQVAIDLFKELP